MRIPVKRLPKHKRGYDKQWCRIRYAGQASEPLCRHCAEQGYLTPALFGDTIILLPMGSHSFDILLPLCSACYALKTAAERSSKKNPPSQ